MASKVKISVNYDEVGRLLRSDGVKNMLMSFADAAAQSLGDGYETSIYDGETRPNASIAAKSYKAKRENMESNTILKALGSVVKK